MDGFDPHHRWLGIPPDEQPPNHYRLLGLVVFESDPEVICDAAERQTAHVRRYALGKHSDLSQQILNELAAAQACLLDPERKSAYDRQLRQRVEPPSTPKSAPRLQPEIPPGLVPSSGAGEYALAEPRRPSPAPPVPGGVPLAAPLRAARPLPGHSAPQRVEPRPTPVLPVPASPADPQPASWFEQYGKLAGLAGGAGLAVVMLAVLLLWAALSPRQGPPVAEADSAGSGTSPAGTAGTEEQGRTSNDPAEHAATPTPDGVTAEPSERPESPAASPTSSGPSGAAARGNSANGAPAAAEARSTEPGAVSPGNQSAASATTVPAPSTTPPAEEPTGQVENTAGLQSGDAGQPSGPAAPTQSTPANPAGPYGQPVPFGPAAPHAQPVPGMNQPPFNHLTGNQPAADRFPPNGPPSMRPFPAPSGTPNSYLNPDAAPTSQYRIPLPSGTVLTPASLAMSAGVQSSTTNMYERRKTDPLTVGLDLHPNGSIAILFQVEGTDLDGAAIAFQSSSYRWDSYRGSSSRSFWDQTRPSFYGEYEGGDRAGAIAMWDEAGNLQFRGDYTRRGPNGLCCYLEQGIPRLAMQCRGPVVDAVYLMSGGELLKTYENESEAEKDTQTQAVLKAFREAEDQLKQRELDLKARVDELAEEAQREIIRLRNPALRARAQQRVNEEAASQQRSINRLRNFGR